MPPVTARPGGPKFSATSWVSLVPYVSTYSGLPKSQLACTRARRVQRVRSEQSSEEKSKDQWEAEVIMSPAESSRWGLAFLFALGCSLVPAPKKEKHSNNNDLHGLVQRQDEGRSSARTNQSSWWQWSLAVGTNNTRDASEWRGRGGDPLYTHRPSDTVEEIEHRLSGRMGRHADSRDVPLSAMTKAPAGEPF